MLACEQTFVVMALGYLVFMIGGAFGYRVPPVGWTPAGYQMAARDTADAARRHVHVTRAFSIPQFWLVWMRPLHERVCGDWRHRHGLADAAGSVWRIAPRAWRVPSPSSMPGS